MMFTSYLVLDCSRRLCELGVNVGDANSVHHGDASVLSDELEGPYNLFGIRSYSPNFPNLTLQTSKLNK